MPIKFHEGSKTFHIYNKHLSYITCIMENGQMENLYYGKAIRDKEDFSYLHEEIMRSLMAVCVPEPGLLSMQYTKQEYPVYGTGDYRNPALTVRQENGSEIVDFKYVSRIVRTVREVSPDTIPLSTGYSSVRTFVPSALSTLIPK